MNARALLFLATGLLIEALHFVLVPVSGRPLRLRVGAVLSVLVATWLVSRQLCEAGGVPRSVLVKALVVGTGIRFLGWASLGIGMPLAEPVAYLVAVPVMLVLFAGLTALHIFPGAWIANRFGRC